MRRLKHILIVKLQIKLLATKCNLILFLKPNSVKRFNKKNAFQFTSVKDQTLNKSGGKKLSFDKQVFYLL